MKPTNNNDDEFNKYNGKAYAYISIASIIACAVFLGLMFTRLSIYALISSILLALCALAFANIQKSKNPFKGLKIIIVISYVMLIVSILIFVGGIIWGQLNKS